MSQKSYFSIKSSIEITFENSQVRDYSYNSYLPGLKKLQTRRSKVTLEKKENTLLFQIESSDITAFRASVSDIIGFGKIINNCLELCEQ